jgi:diguanylate cyclase (GGDEF)-like protein
MKLIHPSLSLQNKLRLIGALVSIGLVAVGLVSHFALLRTQVVTQQVVTQTAALSQLQSADMAHDALRSHVYAALLVGEATEIQADDVRRGTRENTATLRDAMQRLSTLQLEADAHAELLASRASAERYLEVAERTITQALSDRRAAQAMLPHFNAAFGELLIAFDKATGALRQLNESAVAHADTVKADAQQQVLATAALTFILTVIMVAWIGRSIRASLRGVQTVADAVAQGELTRRAEITGADEVGRMGAAVNAMADKLQALLDQALQESVRHGFGRDLNDALEMADSEPEAYRVIQRAMSTVSQDRPMELLVSDSSQAVLQRATEHASAGAPGCGVESPFACQAVRRGNSVSFDDSEALNACPRLRDRAGNTEAISAVCVPLHFMGRALGVLHTTGPAHQPPSAAQRAQLAAIGTQAAARIGVVRAFERTQLQAATDAATGLANRRSLEAAVRELLRKKQPFAFVMADLDRFKMLNDTHGHLVGDEALHLFAQTMKRAVREQDTAARWGGEEFAFVLSGSNASQALEWAERARSALAQALSHSKVPKFTVSLGIADSSMAGRMEELLRIADHALYRSKDAGRDRATLGDATAANDPITRQGSEHQERIDLAQLNARA